MLLKRELKTIIPVALLILLVSCLTYFFLGVGWSNQSIFSKIFITLATLILLSLAYRKSFSALTLVFLTYGGTFVSLGVSFGSKYLGDSPISLNIILNPWIIFFISLLFSLTIWFFYEKINYKEKYPLLLLIVYLVVWCILAVNVKYFGEWKIENYLTIPFIILIYITHRWFKFSKISYSLIFIFMTLHIFGSHYTYAEVPFGFWLSNLLGVTRNHYDRIVHFSFGLLLVYPIREIFRRIADVKGFWAFYIPIELVLAFSCIYEIIEWGVAIIYGGDLGIAYLGSQGDIWDAQKDMFLAGIGALISMIITSAIVIYYDRKGFWKELKESFSVKEKEVLGENSIQKMANKKK